MEMFLLDWSMVLNLGFDRGNSRESSFESNADGSRPLRPNISVAGRFQEFLSGNPTKVKPLMELEGAKDRLHLFKANLMEKGSFDAAISGCDGVFHTASPVNFSPDNPQEDVLDPAIKGTLNVLESCKSFQTVKRVVLTSSFATVIITSNTLAPDVVVDETWFSDPELCKGSNMMCYALSKVLAEEAAWKYTKENNIDMVSINPGNVIGPMLQPAMSAGVGFILNLINGSEFYPNISCPWVHIKDTVEAHIRAFEIPSANGRYILGERVLHFSDILKILRDLYPSLKLPDKIQDAGPIPNEYYQISKSKVKSLGIEYIPFETSLGETIECLKDKKFV